LPNRHRPLSSAVRRRTRTAPRFASGMPPALIRERNAPARLRLPKHERAGALVGIRFTFLEEARAAGSNFGPPFRQAGHFTLPNNQQAVEPSGWSSGRCAHRAGTSVGRRRRTMDGSLCHRVK
jgi:hypothetical protein